MTSLVIAICTYNNARLLHRALASLSLQAIPDDCSWSAIVVDNNSSDDTQEIVAEFMSTGKIPRLRVVREPRQGLAFARRRAVVETDEEIIAFVDDDCMLAPDWVYAAYSFAKQHPQAGAIGGRVHLVWETSPPEFAYDYQGSLAYQDHGDHAVQMPATGYTYLVGAGLVVRRSALEASGWFSFSFLTGRNGQSLSSGDDSEIVLRIRRVGYELWYSPNMILHHYIPTSRTSVEYLCQLQRGITQSTPILEVLAMECEPTLSSCLHRLYRSLLRFLKYGYSIARYEGLHFKPMTPRRHIGLWSVWGSLEGSWLLVRHCHKLLHQSRLAQPLE